MSEFTIVQLLGKVLADYHVGHAVFLFFVLALPLGIVKKSTKLLSLVLIAFGGLFFIVPSLSDAEPLYSFAGILLMVLGPMAYATADR